MWTGPYRSPMDPEVLAHYDEGAEHDASRRMVARATPDRGAAGAVVAGAAGAGARCGGRSRAVRGVDGVVRLGLGDAARSRSAARRRRRPRWSAATTSSSATGGGCRIRTGTFDVVLVLGPLYHLVDARRPGRGVATEARRVAALGRRRRWRRRSRGSRRCSTGCRRGFIRDERFRGIVARDLVDGTHRNPSREPGWFTTAFFHAAGAAGRARCGQPG